MKVNQNKLTSELYVEEDDIVKKGDKILKYTNGKINKISSVGTYSTSGTTFPVSVSIKNDGNIKIGMSANITIKG